MRKIIVKSLLVLAALAVALLGLWAAYRQQMIGSAFQRSAVGEPEADLLARLGTPWRTSECAKTFGGAAPNDCAMEVLYASPFAPLLPQYWGFRYDRGGRLIEKFHYTSP
jgi:hypothetical protein